MSSTFMLYQRSIDGVSYHHYIKLHHIIIISSSYHISFISYHTTFISYQYHILQLSYHKTICLQKSKKYNVPLVIKIDSVSELTVLLLLIISIFLQFQIFHNVTFVDSVDGDGNR